MSFFIFSNFGSFTKLIYCLAISVILTQAQVTSQKAQYLLVDVLVDSKNCTNNDSRWSLQQQIVFEILRDHPELNLAGSGKYCGCRFSKSTVCKSNGGKAVESLLYDSKNGHINVAALPDINFGQIPPGIVSGNVTPYFVCANPVVITAVNQSYKTCNHLNLADFNNTMTKSMAASSAEPSGPGTGVIIGAALGALAALGLLLALGSLAYKHIKSNRQVDDSGSSSDITPIIPGAPGFGDAPNSVPPAGTG